MNKLKFVWAMQPSHILKHKIQLFFSLSFDFIFLFSFLNLSCFCFSGAWLLYLLLIFRQIYTNKHFWNRFERFICKSPSKGFLFSAKTIINIFDAARVQNSYIHNEKIKTNRKIKLWKFSMRLFHDECLTILLKNSQYVMELNENMFVIYFEWRRMILVLTVPKLFMWISFSLSIPLYWLYCNIWHRIHYGYIFFRLGQ